MCAQGPRLGAQRPRRALVTRVALDGHAHSHLTSGEWCNHISHGTCRPNTLSHTQRSLYSARSWHLHPHAGRWNELIDHGMLRSDSEADVSITMTDGAPTLERNTGPYCSRRPLPLTHPRRERESPGDRDSVCVCVVCVWVSITREGRHRRTNRRPSAGRRSFCLRATARSAPRPHLPAHMRARACVSGWRQTLCYFVSCGDLGGVKITYPYLCACAVCANEEMYASSIQAWSLGRSQCRERRREGVAGESTCT